MIKVVILSSTNGTLVDNLLNLKYFKDRVSLIATDRQCGIIEVANSHEIPYKIFPSKDGKEFSEKLSDYFYSGANEIKPPDIFVSFYTRLFKGDFINKAIGRLINLHPSILPSFPGLSGFEDTVSAHSKFIGSTIHLVNAQMDQGWPIIQAATPFDPRISISKNRHKIFLQQGKSLLQTIKYYEEERIYFDEIGVPVIINAKYENSEFAPNLDEDLPVLILKCWVIKLLKFQMIPTIRLRPLFQHGIENLQLKDME